MRSILLINKIKDYQINYQTFILKQLQINRFIQTNLYRILIQQLQNNKIKSVEMQTLRLIIFLAIFLNCIYCNNPDVEYLSLSQLNSQIFEGNTYQQNKTYQLDPSIFSKQYGSYFIEMELNINRFEQDDIQILFALSQTFSLQQNNKTNHYEADFIDKRGFYMKKKYYRIDFEKSYLIEQNPLYLTIFQATQNVINLSFTLKFGIQDSGFQKMCPFDCFSQNSQGICNQKTGKCECLKGYFDFDCSRQSLNLDFYREQSNNYPYYFTWKTTFSKQQKAAFYYQIQNELSGYLYLQIKKRDKILSTKKISENDDLGYLNIFFTSENQNSSNLFVADIFFSTNSFRLTEQQLIDGEEIFLYSFKPVQRNLLNDERDTTKNHQDHQSTNFNNQINLQNYIQLLFGFRQEWKYQQDNDIIEYDMVLLMKNEGPQQQLLQDASLLSSKNTIIVMSIILVLLIFILIILVVYLHRKTQLINIAISNMKKKKFKKEEELNNVLDLIPPFKYTQELKNQLQQGQEEAPACPVCLCEFELDEDIRKTYCSHHFHADCLQEWIKKQKNCPQCRNILTPRTMAIKQQNPQQNGIQDQSQIVQIFKSPKKNKDYIQQIDVDISINISKISKKSNSPTKISQKFHSPNKFSKKSASPPKISLEQKIPDISDIITTVRPHNKKLSMKRAQSQLPQFKNCYTPQNISLQQIQSFDNTIDASIKIKSDPHIPPISNLMQSDFQGVTMFTENQTQAGERTNSHFKNRGSILSQANSMLDSNHKIKQSENVMNKSSKFKKADSLSWSEN
ncbi:hypothetical protein ABPG72_016397 [Tetrahymena utriculariae]